MKTMKTETLREKVTQQVIDLMETHGTSWAKPWTGGAAGAPTNLVSKNPYHGINTFLLMAEERCSPVWATYKQWEGKGHQVMKGEKSTHIIFYKILERERQNNGGETVKDRIPLMRSYSVFNAEQVEGGEEYTLAPVEGAGEIFQRNNLDAFVSATAADIRHGGARAFFSPSTDHIQLPPMEAFTGTETSSPEESYYSALSHELIHWSGHAPRLDRLKATRFGSKDYAYEELIAELGAAFLSVEFGLSAEPRPDHAKYLNSWMESLKNNNRLIFKAAAAASRAIDHLHGYSTSAATTKAA